MQNSRLISIIRPRKNTLTWIGLGVGFGIVILIIGASYRNELRYTESRNLLIHTYEVISRLQRTFSTLQDAETGQRGYLLTEQDTYLNPFYEAVDNVRRQIGSLSELTADNPKQQKRLAEIQSVIDKKFNELQETILLRKERGLEEALHIVLTGKGKALMDEIREIMNQMQNEEERLLKQRGKKLEKEMFARRVAMMLGGVVALSFFALSAFLAHRNVVRQQIEDFNRRIRESLDNVAHDLRTPLMRLRGKAELALQSSQDSEVYQEALSDCLEESERLVKMLNTLLDIAEAETGTMKVESDHIDVQRLVTEILEVYSCVAEDKNVSIHFSCPTDVHFIGDSSRIQQAIANMVDNAIKYTAKNGKIEVDIERKDQRIFITIKDNGIGIEPEEISKIWDRLYRGEKSRSERGLGLGLSLVRAVVLAHRGQIEVFSEPGKGSIFVVSLPIRM